MTGLGLPLVSIIVPNWNGEGLLRDCLTSLYSLDYPHFEVIVVDNCSADNSVSLIRKEFKDTVVVVNPSNLGFAGACNAGIKVAKGEIIALFNNDALADPLWLKEVVQTILEDDKIAIAGGPIFYAQPNDLIWSAGMQVDAFTGTTWRVGHKKRFNPTRNDDDFDYLTGCALIIKKKVIDEVGLLDETFFLYGEEVDWTFRALRLGYKFKFNNSAIVWHKASISRRKNPSKGYYYFVRSRFRNYFIHYPFPYLVTSVFFQLTVFPLSEILLFSTPSVYFLERLKGFWWNIANLRNTMRIRKQVNSLGQLKLKNRFRAFLAVSLDDQASKSYDF